MAKNTSPVVGFMAMQLSTLELNALLALVKEGRSNGGMFTWDATDLRGQRVVSGVYVVLEATEEGKSGVACKVAVVN